MEQSNLNSKISAKYVTVVWTDSGTQIWVFLCNVYTEKPF